MSDYAEHLNQISESQVDKEVVANANFAAASPAMLFARDQRTTSLLTWGYYGGRFNGTLKANGTVALTASATNYIVVHRTTLVVSKATNTTNWNDTTTYGRAYLVTTGASAPTNYEDHRHGENGILGGGGAGGGAGDGLEEMSVPVNLQTGTTYTILDGDRAKLVTFTNASSIAITLPQAGSALAGSPTETGFEDGWFVFIQNRGAGTATITPTTSTIDTAASLVLKPTDGVLIASNGTNYYTMRGKRTPVVIMVACSDETTDLTTGTGKVTFRMPHAMTLLAGHDGVRANVKQAASSGTLTIDINESGSTILSTKLTIDAGEKTSTTAAVAPVLSDTSLADDAEMTVDIDSLGSGSVLPRGLKIALIGYAA